MVIIDALNMRKLFNHTHVTSLLPAPGTFFLLNQMKVLCHAAPCLFKTILTCPEGGTLAFFPSVACPVITGTAAKFQEFSN